MELPVALVALASGQTEDVIYKYSVKEAISRQREAIWHRQSCQIKFCKRSNVITKLLPCPREAEASQRKGGSGFEAECSQVVSSATASSLGRLHHG